MMPADHSEANPGAIAAFPVTRWSLITRAQTGGSESTAALDEICRRYWYPLYAFLRRSNVRREDAEDLTQGFFVRVVTNELLRAVARERGRLRNFLLAALKRHLADHCRAVQAEKRGGRATHVPIEWDTAEERYSVEPADERDPETLYLRAWAQSLLENVRAQLRAAFTTNRTQLPAGAFEIIEPYLAGDDDCAPYRELGLQLGTNESTARVLIFRMRRKYRELIEEEVARTISDEDDLAEEMAWLRSTLGR